MTNDPGVDISKDHLDAHRMRDGASRRFANDHAGHDYDHDRQAHLHRALQPDRLAASLWRSRGCLIAMLSVVFDEIIDRTHRQGYKNSKADGKR